MKKSKYQGLTRTDLLELFAEQLTLNEELKKEYQKKLAQKRQQEEKIKAASSQMAALADLYGLYDIARKIVHACQH